MGSDQLPPVRVDSDLRERVDEYRDTEDLDSVSEAVRQLLLQGLESGTSSDREVIGNLREKLNDSILEEVDVVEKAGGEDAITKDELLAAYRFQNEKATLDDIVKILEIVIDDGEYRYENDK